MGSTRVRRVDEYRSEWQPSEIELAKESISDLRHSRGGRKGSEADYGWPEP